MTHVSRKKHTEESRPPAPSAFNCSVLALATTRFVPLYNSLCTILCAVSIARIYHLLCLIDRYNDQSSCSLYLYHTIEHPARFLTLLSIALARSSSDAQLAYAILSPQISSKLLTVRVALFAEWGSENRAAAAQGGRRSEEVVALACWCACRRHRAFCARLRSRLQACLLGWLAGKVGPLAPCETRRRGY